MTDRGPLTARMDAYTEGQVTWPDLSRSERCFSCGYFEHDQKRPPLGKCLMVRIVSKCKAVKFSGNAGRACGYYQRGTG